MEDLTGDITKMFVPKTLYDIYIKIYHSTTNDLSENIKLV